MTNEEKINRLRDIQRCTPIHTRGDIRDFEALEGGIEALEALSKIQLQQIEKKDYPFEGLEKYDLFKMDNLVVVPLYQVIDHLLQPQGEWISVEDRLPEDGTQNLWTDGEHVTIERYKADAIDHFYPPGKIFQLEDAIAWMPLPKPYEPQESEE